MTWREAFIAQAKHEFSLFRQFNEQRANFADQLHYLQMATEKLARGYLLRRTDTAPPPMTHAGFVRMLQHLKTNPHLRRLLGYQSPHMFRDYIDSLLALAGTVQSLAPAIAGATHANPEYPWLDRGTNHIVAPFQSDFAEFHELRNAGAGKLLKLLQKLFLVISA